MRRGEVRPPPVGVALLLFLVAGLVRAGVLHLPPFIVLVVALFGVAEGEHEGEGDGEGEGEGEGEVGGGEGEKQGGARGSDVDVDEALEVEVEVEEGEGVKNCDSIVTACVFDLGLGVVSSREMAPPRAPAALHAAGSLPDFLSCL